MLCILFLDFPHYISTHYKVNCQRQCHGLESKASHWQQNVAIHLKVINRIKMQTHSEVSDQWTINYKKINTTIIYMEPLQVDVDEELKHLLVRAKAVERRPRPG